MSTAQTRHRRTLGQVIRPKEVYHYPGIVQRFAQYRQRIIEAARLCRRQGCDVRFVDERVIKQEHARFERRRPDIARPFGRLVVSYLANSVRREIHVNREVSLGTTVGFILQLQAVCAVTEQLAQALRVTHWLYPQYQHSVRAIFFYSQEGLVVPVSYVVHNGEIEVGSSVIGQAFRLCNFLTRIADLLTRRRHAQPLDVPVVSIPAHASSF